MAYYRGMNRQISAKEFQERSAEILKQNPDYSPVIMTRVEETGETVSTETINTAMAATSTVARRTDIYKNWWGKAWGKNLERFAYISHGENQIKRGEKAVLNNGIVDLKIDKGNVKGRVIGNSSVPFEVTATIKPLPEDKIDEAVALATGKIQNIDALVAGDFPEDLTGILFPGPVDVELTCNCPDFSYDYICPHTSAILYGIGVRIDRDPLLLFEIRGIDVDGFIWRVVSGRVEKMLENADKDSNRILKGIDLVAKFGVDEADTKIFEAPVLEECPFCGHNDYEWVEADGKHGAYCKNCGAGLPLEYTMEDYARIWNHWKQTEIKHTNTSLRACPICGAFEIQRCNEYNWFWFRCTECGCECGGAENRGEAVQGWNSRYIPADQASLLLE